MLECSDCIYDNPWPQDCDKGWQMIHPAEDCIHFKRKKGSAK